MGLLREADRKTLEQEFQKELVQPVRLLVFTKPDSKLILPGREPCQYCKETVQLVQEVAELSPLLSAEVVDIEAEPDKARQYGIDKAPAILVANEVVHGARWFGIPAGYEFGAMIDTIVDVSKGKTRLPDAIKQQLAAIKEKVHIQVFVTPT